MTLNFTLTNLYIKGKDQGESSIDLVLNYGSGSNCVFLKPIVVGEGTGNKLGMSAIQCDGRKENKHEPSVVKFVDQIWDRSDVNEDGTLC